MDDLDNKYLHKIDLKELSKETGLSINEIAALAEIGPKVVYKWQYMHKDSSRPDFNTIIRLLLKGATTETLFGVDYSAIHKTFDLNKRVSEIMDSPRFQEMVRRAVEDVKSRNEKTE